VKNPVLVGNRIPVVYPSITLTAISEEVRIYYFPATSQAFCHGAKLAWCESFASDKITISWEDDCRRSDCYVETCRYELADPGTLRLSRLSWHWSADSLYRSAHARMRISAYKSADIRNNMFTADKNLIQARIADKTADTSLKLPKKFPVFYCLDKSVE
jgi:hypothetical protein